MGVAAYDEQDLLTSENFQILESSGNEVLRYSNNLSYVLTYLQDVTFAFSPTAQTINPSGLMFTVKYSMKDTPEITDNMLKNNYTVEVQTLRSHFTTVSETLGDSFFMCTCINWCSIV